MSDTEKLTEKVPTPLDLGRRALRQPGWRWLKGTVNLHGIALPDFSDPATLGCLLALVREAWDDPSLYLAPRFERDDDGSLGTRWVVCSLRHLGAIVLPGRGPAGYGHTEAEALVCALENAPTKPTKEVPCTKP